jgi:hypothetical protein
MSVLLLSVQPAVVAKTSNDRLENKSYVDARKIIIGYGWRSYQNVEYCSSGNKADSCKATPELYWCKFAENCQISFYKQDQCLYLDVAGGPRWNSYRVKKVKFARGQNNCPTKI